MKKKNWWKLSDMEKKEMRKSVEEIWQSFHSVAFREIKGKQIDFFHQTCWDLVGNEMDAICKKLNKIDPENQISEDDLYDGLVDRSFFCGFAFGYIVAQRFNLNDPQAVKEIKKLQKVFEKYEAFPKIPWIPREKKAA